MTFYRLLHSQVILILIQSEILSNEYVRRIKKKIMTIWVCSTIEFSDVYCSAKVKHRLFFIIRVFMLISHLERHLEGINTKFKNAAIYNSC